MARQALAALDSNDSAQARTSEAASNARARPAKRSKGARATDRSVQSASARTRSKKKLAALFELPLDIIYEILSHLHPAHLLNVSRTNKALRQILMCKNARSVWRSSFANAQDVPPVPDDLTEPQYARLLFDKSCMFCLTPNTSTVAWAARIRSCKRCLPPFCAEEDMFGIVELLRYDVALTQLVPSSRMKDRHGEGRFYPCEEISAVLEAGEEVWNDEDAARPWLKEMVQKCEKREAHGRLLEEWDDRRQDERARELDEIHHQRKNAIYDKLRALGWGEEVVKSDAKLSSYSAIARAQPLTNYGWQKIMHEVIAHVKIVRERRLAEEKRVAIRARYKRFAGAYEAFRLTKPIDAVLPAVGNLVLIDSVRTAIEETPVDQDLPEAFYRDIVDGIPESWYAEWRARCEKALLDKMSEALGEVVPPSSLHLATTLFSHGCSLADLARVVRYPDLLADPLMMDTLDPGAWEIRSRTGYAPWSATEIDFSLDLHDYACRLLRMTGRAPETTTMEEMRALDPLYSFERPTQNNVLTHVARWPHVVRDGLNATAIALVPEPLAAEIRNCISLIEWRPHWFVAIPARCAHCDAAFKECEALYAHLESV